MATMQIDKDEFMCFYEKLKGRGETQISAVALIVEMVVKNRA